MNGILIVDKPTDWTSFDVIAKLRGILGTRKLGHSGTLDPMATGVLPVFAGPAAKAVDLQTDHTKAYRAVVRFGLSTDTGDVTGTVLQQAHTQVTAQDLEQVLPRFTGDIQQMPPMYSAIKVNGTALYKLARQGITVERKLRPVTIHQLTLVEQCGPQDFVLDVDCSKGTYVRSLVEDLGSALGVPATLAGLRRTRAGIFGLEHSHTLEEIQQAKEQGTLDQLLVAVDTVFVQLPAVTVNEKGEQRLRNGALCYRTGQPAGRCRIYGPQGFLGLGQVLEDASLKAEKLFVERA